MKTYFVIFCKSISITLSVPKINISNYDQLSVEMRNSKIFNRKLTNDFFFRAAHYLHNQLLLQYGIKCNQPPAEEPNGQFLRSFNVFICIISKINTRSESIFKLSSFRLLSASLYLCVRLPFKIEAPNGHQMWLLQKHPEMTLNFCSQKST